MSTNVLDQKLFLGIPSYVRFEVFMVGGTQSSGTLVHLVV